MSFILNPPWDPKPPEVLGKVPTKISVSPFLQSDAGWRGEPLRHGAAAPAGKQHVCGSSAGGSKQVIPSPGSFCSVFLSSSNHFSPR